MKRLTVIMVGGAVTVALGIFVGWLLETMRTPNFVMSGVLTFVGIAGYCLTDYINWEILKKRK